MFNFLLVINHSQYLAVKLDPSTDCTFVLQTMKNSQHLAVKLAPSISLREALAKNVQLSSKKRATGVRILLFELRYFGGDIGILSPHLQLTASGPNKLRKKRKFAYYANKNDSSHHVTKSKIIVNENISQNLKIKSGAFPRHQDQ